MNLKCLIGLHDLESVEIFLSESRKFQCSCCESYFYYNSAMRRPVKIKRNYNTDNIEVGSLYVLQCKKTGKYLSLNVITRDWTLTEKFHEANMSERKRDDPYMLDELKKLLRRHCAMDSRCIEQVDVTLAKK